MVLKSAQDELAPGNDSIILLTLKTSNRVNQKFQPKFGGLAVDHRMYGDMWYRTPPVKSSDKQFNDYLLSVRLKSGTRNFRSIAVGDNIPLVVIAGSAIEFNQELILEPGKTYYLGRVEAVLRPKQSGEKAAAIFPLIDAAVMGYSRGAWDVTVRDNYNADMALMHSLYPATSGVSVEKQILPAWTRPN